MQNREPKQNCNWKQLKTGTSDDGDGNEDEAERKTARTLYKTLTVIALIKQKFTEVLDDNGVVVVVLAFAFAAATLNTVAAAVVVTIVVVDIRENDGNIFHGKEQLKVPLNNANEIRQSFGFASFCKPKISTSRTLAIHCCWYCCALETKRNI